jgi:hypothetical protein
MAIISTNDTRQGWQWLRLRVADYFDLEKSIAFHTARIGDDTKRLNGVIPYQTKTKGFPSGGKERPSRTRV